MLPRLSISASLAVENSGQPYFKQELKRIVLSKVAVYELRKHWMTRSIKGTSKSRDFLQASGRMLCPNLWIRHPILLVLLSNASDNDIELHRD